MALKIVSLWLFAGATLESDGVTAIVHRRSGKISYGFTNSTTRGTVTLSSFQEVDEDGNAVGVQGKTQSTKHSVTSFASKDFTVSDVTDSDDLGVSAKKIEYSLSMINGSSLNVYLYIATDFGEVDAGDETFDVVPGDLKVMPRH
jgi:hypothetical protein